MAYLPKPGLIAVALVAGACTGVRTPSQVISAMRDAACAGNTERYFSNTDQTAVARELGDHLMAGMTKAMKEKLSPAAAQVLVEGMEPRVRDAAATWATRLDGYATDDLKLGAQSSHCAVTIGTERIDGNEAHVLVTTPRGIRREIRLTRRSDRWLVTSVAWVVPEDREKADRLPPELSDPTPPAVPEVPPELMSKVIRTEMAYRSLGRN